MATEKAAPAEATQPVTAQAEPLAADVNVPPAADATGGPETTTSMPVAQSHETPTKTPEATLQPQPESSPSAIVKDTTPPPASANSKSSESPTNKASLEVDTSKPEDFEGEIATTEELPSPELIQKLDNYVVLDRHGKSHTFKSLHSGRNVARRILIIFIRHFYCGNCQDYLSSLSESIKTDALLNLPVSTFITVIGCGDPGLIQEYADLTKCPYPIYTDPTRNLFKALGMTRTWDMGEKPAYMRRSVFGISASGVFQGLKHVTSGLATKGGDFKQVGGEFLFEPADVVTPISTPEAAETDRSLDNAIAQQEALRNSSSVHEEEEDVYGSEKKSVTWCHRMRTTRDHVEMPELMEVLGLDGNGKPTDDLKRWAKALQARKGTGLSLASQMSKMSHQSHQSQRRLDLPA